MYEKLAVVAERFRVLFSNSSRESLKDPGLNPAWDFIRINLYMVALHPLYTIVVPLSSSFEL